jgi:Rieske Fe-S protein
MTDPSTNMTSRRGLLAAGGLAVAAAAAGCTTYGANGQPIAPKPASDDGPATAAAPPSLTRTNAVPVGGGIVFPDVLIVVTQPKAGTFKGFTAVCTHLGCTVANVSHRTINCACHGSRYSIDDGAVVAGPATEPLAPREITVTGDAITQG